MTSTGSRYRRSAKFPKTLFMKKMLTLRASSSILPGNSSDLNEMLLKISVSQPPLEAWVELSSGSSVSSTCSLQFLQKASKLLREPLDLTKLVIPSPAPQFSLLLSELLPLLVLPNGSNTRILIRQPNATKSEKNSIDSQLIREPVETKVATGGRLVFYFNKICICIYKCSLRIGAHLTVRCYKKLSLLSLLQSEELRRDSKFPSKSERYSSL